MHASSDQYNDMKILQTMDTAYKNTDLAKGCLTHELDKNMLDRMVFEHLYISGDFAAGDILAEEAEIQDVVQVKEQFHELCRIEGLLLEHKLSAALDWAERHADTLKENVTRPDFLGFLLHRLKFLEVLKNEGAVEGIKYARKHLVQYYESHNEELRMLLGSLAFYKGFGADMDVDSYATEVKSRYSCFWGDDEHLLWEQVRKEFRRQFCYVIGQVCYSHVVDLCSQGWFIYYVQIQMIIDYYSGMVVLGKAKVMFMNYILLLISNSVLPLYICSLRIVHC